MKITVRVRSREAQAAFKAARKEIRRDVADICEDHGRRRVLPKAKQLAPRKAAGFLIIHRSATRVRLKTNASGMNKRMVGYMNFGGAITTPITPKKKKALRLRDGTFVMSVTKPRRSPGLHFMEKAIQGELPALRRKMRRELPKRIQARI